jgi:hypothetical protein
VGLSNLPQKSWNSLRLLKIAHLRGVKLSAKDGGDFSSLRTEDILNLFFHDRPLTIKS